MTNILEYFGKMFKQQKEDSLNRIKKLEASLMTILDEFEQYIHHTNHAYTNK